MARVAIDRIVHSGPSDVVKDGSVHFGFHDRSGRHYVVDHQRHYLGLLDASDRVEWTVAREPVFLGVPNIAAELRFPMYVDSLPDETLVVSNFLDARPYLIDPKRMTAELSIDGHGLGLTDMGNCVVDDDGFIWVNEVTGCKVWRFDAAGAVVLCLGNGHPAFDPQVAGFDEVRFWIYDLRRGPDGNIYVLDSKNFALRVIDVAERGVRPLAGTGASGYGGDGGPAHSATFGSDPTARFDGPISLALDDDANAYVGDRFNHVVRMIDRAMHVNLPQISSMDHHAGRLFATARVGEPRTEPPPVKEHEERHVPPLVSCSLEPSRWIRDRTERVPS